MVKCKSNLLIGDRRGCDLSQSGLINNGSALSRERSQVRKRAYSLCVQWEDSKLWVCLFVCLCVCVFVCVFMCLLALSRLAISLPPTDMPHLHRAVWIVCDLQSSPASCPRWAEQRDNAEMPQQQPPPIPSLSLCYGSSVNCIIFSEALFSKAHCKSYACNNNVSIYRALPEF